MSKLTSLRYLHRHSNNIFLKRKLNGKNSFLSQSNLSSIVGSTQEEVNTAVSHAKNVFPMFRNQTLEHRARLLETIAEEILNLGDTLLQTCCKETSLPSARLTGECIRTCDQLKMFSNILRKKSFLNIAIDLPDPSRMPIPKPDTRHIKIPLGPVAIFGASNFPLAFSVAGGDTASALAAGCPVIFKAHPSHLNTSNLVASAIRKSLISCNLPESVFQLIHGIEDQMGTSLVQHPFIQAVGFTGSQTAGLSFLKTVQRRPIPIPIFAEMGSSNPMFLLPGSFETNGKIDILANGLVNSINLGIGQFCTKPGIIFSLKDDLSDILLSKMETLIKNSPAGIMLNSNISKNYKRKIEDMKKKGFHAFSKGHSENSNLIGDLSIPHLFKIKAKDFLIYDELEHEIFGPSSIFFVCETKEEMLKCALKLNGHLTVSIHGKEDEFDQNTELFDILLEKAGRIMINNFPTGVEVNNSMVHGGPFPATTDLRTSSVGAIAIDRFLRPICYQNFPSKILPMVLKS